MKDKINTHEDLEVWHRCQLLITNIYELTDLMPDEERYELSKQMKRAAISITSNIAEGAARPSTKEYVRFLGIARGSLTELASQTRLVKDLNLVDVQETLLNDMLVIKKMINALMRKLIAKYSK